MTQSIYNLELNYETKEGVVEAFGDIKSHLDVEGIIRYAMMGKEDFYGKGFHLAVHVVSAKYYDQPAEFAIPHQHDFDEINIIIPVNSDLVYDFELDGEKMRLPAPYTLYIPAGVEHYAKPLQGEGIFICIQLDNNINRRADQSKPIKSSRDKKLIATY